jgi:hypothetical protein
VALVPNSNPSFALNARRDNTVHLELVVDINRAKIGVVYILVMKYLL